jgi:hypothetical protein
MLRRNQNGKTARIKAMADSDQDEFPATVEAMADRLGLKGEGRARYIDDHMTGAGYQRVTSYAPGGDDDDDDDGDGGGKSFGSRYGGGQRGDKNGGRKRDGKRAGRGGGSSSRRGGNSSWYDE